ncbi:hypothetical protein, partial [Ralstonia mannitolilytica]|uniref:hypothetical protein n=1 Tax=Ralstonia mannitolilytica TaxID=105219 RepID=UPI002930524A
LRHDLFGFVLLLGHSNVLLRLNSLLQGGPLFRGQTNNSYRTEIGSAIDLALRRREIILACMKAKGYTPQ